MPSTNPTKRQKLILDYIQEFTQMNGFAPSYREIADYFGLSSPATVHQHIKALEDKGLIQAEKKRSRSLRLVKIGMETRPAFELPLVGTITAGKPIEAIEEKEVISIPSDMVNDSTNSFVLKVKGTSMIEDGILDGDFVVCERNFYPNNGDVVVALLNNEATTLKRYYREKTRIRLQPANSTMKPFFAKNPAIQGVVKAVLRKF